MGGGVPGEMGGVLIEIGEIKNFAFFQARKFSKNVRKSMKIYNCLKNFKKILRCFENFGNMDL